MYVYVYDDQVEFQVGSNSSFHPCVYPAWVHLLPTRVTVTYVLPYVLATSFPLLYIHHPVPAGLSLLLLWLLHLKKIRGFMR